MPQDFFTLKNQFDIQNMTATEIPKQYYLQPEFYPEWFNWSNRTYAQTNPRMIGVYGIAAYPSNFTIETHVNQPTTLSAFLHTTWGVEIFQGATLHAVFDEKNIHLQLISPADTFLLYPTYPTFHQNWAIPVVYEITPLTSGNYIIEIYETTPTVTIDNTWKNQYGTNYTSGGSILGLRLPKITINLKAHPQQNLPETIVQQFPYLLFFIMITFFIVLMCMIAYAKKRFREETPTKN